jgi:RES domain-containing protein
VRFTGTCYRAHDPRWAFKPISGDGAAVHGGRFNSKGMPALYLALSPMGAVREANQGFAHKIDPCVLCSYDVDCEDVADLRSAKSRADHGATNSDLACAWHLIAAGGKEPPSWRIVLKLKTQGFAGILVPSFARTAAADDHNLVLWTWSKNRPHRVLVDDPSGKLPKNQLSWD